MHKQNQYKYTKHSKVKKYISFAWAINQPGYFSSYQKLTMQMPVSFLSIFGWLILAIQWHPTFEHSIDQHIEAIFLFYRGHHIFLQLTAL